MTMSLNSYGMKYIQCYDGDGVKPIVPHHPTTVDSAVQLLIDEMPADTLKDLTGSLGSHIIRFHKELGTWIRNNFSNFSDNPLLVADAWTRLPDSIKFKSSPSSMHHQDVIIMIVDALWDKLHE